MEKGSEAITSRAIAQCMGVAHMSLYTYFENQAAILHALSERELSRWRTEQQMIEQRAEKEDISKIVEDMLGFFIAFARKNPNLYRLAWIMPEAGGESIEQTRLRMQDTVGHLANLVKLGIERGEFKVREPFLAAATVLGMVNMPHILFYSGRLVDPTLRDRMIEEVLSAAMLYLKME